MPEYLISGRDRAGHKVTERVEADSADEAVRLFRERDFDEIVLHTDDVSALYSRHRDVEGAFSPRQYLWFRNMPGRLASFLLITIKTYERAWTLYLVPLLLLAYRRYERWPWTLLDYAIILLLLCPLLWALWCQVGRRGADRYREMIEAASWGRWEEVLERVGPISSRIPPEEVAFRKAQALAGLGRLDEALQIVKPFADGKAIPAWLYWSRLAEVYKTAKRYDEGRTADEKAFELAPDNATVLIDVAKNAIWKDRNVKRARDLLARARTHELSDVLRPFATYVEGLIYLEEGQAREALRLLTESYQGASAFRHASPLMGLVLDQMHLPIALAHAALGDLASANRHYELARPRLLALRLDEYIARYAKAIGHFPQ